MTSNLLKAFILKLILLFGPSIYSGENVVRKKITCQQYVALEVLRSFLAKLSGSWPLFLNLVRHFRRRVNWAPTIFGYNNLAEVGQDK